LLGRLHPHFGTPYYAIWLSGILMAALAYFADLTQVVAISTSASLFYYTIANIAALRLPREDRHFPRAISVLGVISCAGLLFFSIFEAPIALIVGVAGLVTGSIFYVLRKKYGEKTF
jgi:APA family basic amino acid/polyamine antiporter